MLFNSHVFIFIFLPATVFGFYLLGGYDRPRAALAWLVTASLFFYGWWNAFYLLLILFSIGFNFLTGNLLNKTSSINIKKFYLLTGIAVNLGIIGYYKYANFFTLQFNRITGTSFHLETIILPLAISFFTFQQITYLVDTYKGRTKEHDFLHYCLFVTFFPQLIAGPIVHHQEMLQQFTNSRSWKLDLQNIVVGMTIFSIGLFKKVVFADSIAVYASPVFIAAAGGNTITFFEAWMGALAYTLQLYFDFSGYSDMAIGLARLFGVKLPLNFHSPYKSKNIIQFWSRWHMTLSRFFRDYVYIPLGGNRCSKLRQGCNLMITMLLGGLWHGAGWHFIIWGGLHGTYLIINHTWQSIYRSFVSQEKEFSFLGNSITQAITLSAIVFSWVFFRAGSVQGALNILTAMAGLDGFTFPAGLQMILSNILLSDFGATFMLMGMHFTEDRVIHESLTYGIFLIALLGTIALKAPNTQEIMERHDPALLVQSFRDQTSPVRWIQFEINRKWAIIVAFIFVTSVGLLTRASEFLYFQF